MQRRSRRARPAPPWPASRDCRQSRHRLLAQLDPDRLQHPQRRDGLLDRPGAVGVDADRDLRPERGADSGQPSGVVADPDLHLDAPEAGSPVRRLPRRLRRPDPAAAIVALTSTAGAPGAPSSRHTGSPARRPARSHSARSIAASAWGAPRARAQAARSSSRSTSASRRIPPTAAGSPRAPRARRRSRRRRSGSGAASPHPAMPVGVLESRDQHSSRAVMDRRARNKRRAQARPYHLKV